MKIFLLRLPLNKYLAETLRANKFAMKSLSKTLFFRVNFKRFPLSRFLAKTLRVKFLKILSTLNRIPSAFALSRSLAKTLTVHTYIIGHYNHSVSIIDQVSHTTYVVCINFIHKWQDRKKTYS